MLRVFWSVIYLYKSDLPFSAKFNSTVSSRGAIHGLSLLSLFIYKYLADVTFTIVSCRVTDTDFVSGRFVCLVSFDPEPTSFIVCK